MVIIKGTWKLGWSLAPSCAVSGCGRQGSEIAPAPPTVNGLIDVLDILQQYSEISHHNPLPLCMKRVVNFTIILYISTADSLWTSHFLGIWASSSNEAKFMHFMLLGVILVKTYSSQNVINNFETRFFIIILRFHTDALWKGPHFWLGKITLHGSWFICFSRWQMAKHKHKKRQPWLSNENAYHDKKTINHSVLFSVGTRSDRNVRIFFM